MCIDDLKTICDEFPKQQSKFHLYALSIFYFVIYNYIFHMSIKLKSSFVPSLANNKTVCFQQKKDERVPL